MLGRSRRENVAKQAVRRQVFNLGYLWKLRNASRNFPAETSPEILAFLILTAFLLFCPIFLFSELVDGLRDGVESQRLFDKSMLYCVNIR